MGAAANVLILGGGFAGIESATYLRRQLPDAQLTVVSDRDYFLFKPNSIYIPFGLDPERLKVQLPRALKKKNIRLVSGYAREVDPERKRVRGTNLDLQYDYLVVATGATMRADEVPGMTEHAATIWTTDAMLDLRRQLADSVTRAKGGRTERVLFLVPPNNKCSGPLYEMVFMLDTYLRRERVRSNFDLSWTTYETGYIQAFGPRLHEYTAGEFERRGIKHYNSMIVQSISSDHVRYANGTQLPFDLLISFPPYAAAVAYPGLPADERGFIKANLTTRQVSGLDDVFVAGDAGDFPVKQAFLAFLQADAAGEQIAARILGQEPRLGFDPVSMCVMEQFDRATFAQVPLELTGNADSPVRVRPGSAADYRLGTGKIWRLGKKLLGAYLPWRFRAARPFHAGLPWKAMDLGLRIMSRLLATPDRSQK